MLLSPSGESDFLLLSRARKKRTAGLEEQGRKEGQFWGESDGQRRTKIRMMGDVEGGRTLRFGYA